MRWSCLLLPLWVLGPACSLVKLSDDIVQGTCTTHDDCDELNRELPPEGFPCIQWQCEQDGDLCQVGPLDHDHDGQSPAMAEADGARMACEDDPAHQDCDDEAGDIAAGADELCDRHDNDCDGDIDEGALRSDARVLLSLSAPASDLQLVRDADTGTLAFGYALELAASLPGVALREGLDSRGTATALNDADADTAEGGIALRAAQTAVASLGDDEFAVAFVNTAEVERVNVGLTSKELAPAVRFSPDIATYGLSCQADEACAANPPEADEPPIESPPSAATALAAHGTYVAVSYLRVGQEPSECGALGEPHQVLANLLVRDGSRQDAPVLRELGEGPRALRVGDSSDLSPPAMLALEGGDPQWLIGYPAADGQGVIDLLARRDQRLELAQSALVALPGQGPHSQLKLAAGPELEDGFVLGSVYQGGCGQDTRILLSLHAIRRQAGAVEAEALQTGIEISAGRNLSSPSLAYSAARQSWLVAYRQGTELRGRLLTRDGRVRDAGQQPYVLVDNDDGGAAALLTPAILPLPDSDPAWFAIVAQVLRGGGTRAIEVIDLGCR